MVKYKSCCSKRRSSSASEQSDEDGNTKETPLWLKILIYSGIALFTLILIVFLIIWVLIPVVFSHSIAFQRMMIFIPFNSPRNPHFDDPSSYAIEGVHNIYITVSDYYDNTTLTTIGAWLILPEELVGVNDSLNISDIIRETDYDIVFYLHGVYANRAKPIHQYSILRKHFLVLAIDHRGYGDSGSNVEMGELGMVHDHLQIYNWILEKGFKNDIFYWGHSLGAAISCHTVRSLKETYNFIPKGLILESPFTTLREEIQESIVGKIYSWLAYFNSTILGPLDDNGFHFYSTTNILQVDCPIMILHAEDDSIVPAVLGQKLASVACNERQIPDQGNVTFHLFSSDLGYGHNDILTDENVPEYIRSFKKVCEEFINTN
ncbi:lysophosphatidylserine lipase ABHD12-like isoform X2 [Euwallacea similis]|uniref:lysophosphatidylserine lipase ABHD12-like isoform X2 n=1 Tax=Euwallacea similis TaxID=1736056 RepID=UPI00344B875D